ncbi:hypothetical protein L3Q82_022054 [Scortum barcoo]|uniref:Uncharacterized protein n=1 Tax=Scortum barcoo TaxID=214431 RepID=A0ACB8X1K6_9TELE|nr:hypothetical protein L3Q82_022054 [Scortum barcoo]
MKPLVVEGEDRLWAAEARGHVKAFLSSCMFYTGPNRTIHLNQSAVHAALVPVIMYDAARVPSPKDGANGMVPPIVPGAGAGTAAGSGGPMPTATLQAKTEEGQPGTEEEEEEPKAEPVLVKKPHREILDHERKRRVELKCMELQEMMEEQGYTEEEIRQKVSTFRQMLMDKEGVITREGSHTQAAAPFLLIYLKLALIAILCFVNFFSVCRFTFFISLLLPVFISRFLIEAARDVTRGITLLSLPGRKVYARGTGLYEIRPIVDFILDSGKKCGFRPVEQWIRASLAHIHMCFVDLEKADRVPRVFCGGGACLSMFQSSGPRNARKKSLELEEACGEVLGSVWGEVWVRSGHLCSDCCLRDPDQSDADGWMDGWMTRVNHLHYQPDEYEEDSELVGYEDGDYGHDYHSDNRVKRKSSSSPSPRPKKRKKKKSGRRRSRFGSSSPTHREKKKKSGKKHKRDRSASGSRKKRRYRSVSPKNKHKDKNKQKKRSPGETPSRSSQRQGSCCSSRSASLSSTRSTSKSPARLNSKHKTDGQKASGTSLSPGPNTPTTWHNGDHTQRSRNGKAGRLNHAEGEKGHDSSSGPRLEPSHPLRWRRSWTPPMEKLRETAARCPSSEVGKLSELVHLSGDCTFDTLSTPTPSPPYSSSPPTCSSVSCVTHVSLLLSWHFTSHISLTSASSACRPPPPPPPPHPPFRLLFSTWIYLVIIDLMMVLDRGITEKLRLLTASSASIQSTLLREHKLHSAPSRSQTGQTCAAREAGSVDGRNAAVGSSVGQTSGRRGSQRGQNKSSHSPAHSSDSAHSQHNHTHRGRSSRHQRKAKGGHSSKRHHRSNRGQAHHRSPSVSPGHHSHTSGRKKEERRPGANLTSDSAAAPGAAAVHRHAPPLRDRGPSKAKSPHNRQNNSRERDSPNRSDTDSRARRRSRSYSPIRKRRRDSPSFMEARRITSARKRPIPYYRPSPSSSSYDSSPSRSSRSRSRSYSSYSRSRSHSRSHNRSHSRSRSRSWSRSQSRSWSRSRSRSRSHHSYYSRSSYDSPGF